MKTKTSIVTAGLLMASLIAASPAALAERYGKHDKGYGHRDKQEMCENFSDGRGPFNPENRQAEMQQRRAEMADRLKLTEEQRAIWAEIQQERQDKMDDRRARWQEKVSRHCDDKGQTQE